MATIGHYMADPEVRKRSWRMRLEMGIDRREPNAGHRALAELERRGRLDTLITQNVDGLHQKGGVSPQSIVEIHGTLQEVVCMDCGERAPIERALARVRAGEDDPACRSCGGILKSATISFGQSLVMEDLRRAERAAHGCDLLLAIGTTLAVYPIAGVVPIAKSAGARIVILNAEPTEMDDLADAVLRGSISEILPRLVAELAAPSLGERREHARVLVLREAEAAEPPHPMAKPMNGIPPHRNVIVRTVAALCSSTPGTKPERSSAKPTTPTMTPEASFDTRLHAAK